MAPGIWNMLFGAVAIGLGLTGRFKLMFTDSPCIDHVRRSRRHRSCSHSREPVRELDGGRAGRACMSGPRPQGEDVARRGRADCREIMREELSVAYDRSEADHRQVMYSGRRALYSARSILITWPRPSCVDSVFDVRHVGVHRGVRRHFSWGHHASRRALPAEDLAEEQLEKECIAARACRVPFFQMGNFGPDVRPERALLPETQTGFKNAEAIER